MITLKPLSKFGYQTFPKVDGMIELPEVDIQAIRNRTKCFNADLTGVENYIPPAPTPEELEARYKANIITAIRERYTTDDEIAILRQKEEKPAEYQVYFDYCEQCKAKARTNTGYGGTTM